MSQLKPPKILLWDLECSNLDADFGIILCGGVRELGKRSRILSISDYAQYALDPTNDRKVVEELHSVLSGADMWVTYYGTGFDLPFLNARAMGYGLTPLPPIPHVDLYFIARRYLKLHRRSLGVVGGFLNARTGKTAIAGPIWIRALAGHRPSLKYVIRHCKQDIELLEEVYLKLRPFIRTHPLVGDIGTCRVCGSSHMVKQGIRVLRGGPTSKVKQRSQCKNCGAWAQVDL